MAGRPDIHPTWLAAMLAAARIPMPRPIARQLFALIGRLHGLGRPPFLPRSRQLAEVAVGGVSQRWLYRWWRHVGEVMAWNRNGKLPAGELEGVDALRGGGLVIGGHFGPYLFAAPLLARHGLQPMQIADPLPMAWADRAIFERYRSNGWLLHNPAGPAALSRTVLRTLRDGGLVLATVDQAPGEHDNRLALPFLRGTLHAPVGVFELARQARVPVFALTLDPDDRTLLGTLTGPLHFPHVEPDAEAGLARAALTDVVAACVGQLAAAVERDPTGWNWMLPQLTGPDHVPH